MLYFTRRLIRNKEVFVKHEKAPTVLQIQGVFTLSYMPMFKKKRCFEHFGQIRPFPVAEPGQNGQKAHLQVKTFHMSLFQGLYDHPLQRNSLEKLMFRKTLILDILAKFDHFRWPNLAKSVKRHIYRPRPFIWAYSQVSTTIRYKKNRLEKNWWQTDGHPESIGPQPLGLGPKKNMTDRWTDRRTDTPNL